MECEGPNQEHWFVCSDRDWVREGWFTGVMVSGRHPGTLTLALLRMSKQVSRAVRTHIELYG